MIEVKHHVITKLGDSVALVLRKSLFENGEIGHFVKITVKDISMDIPFISVIRDFDKHRYFITIPSSYSQAFNIFKGDYIDFDIYVSNRSVRE